MGNALARISLVLSFLALSACEPATSREAAPAKPQIGVVDLDRVLQTLGRDKHIMEQIQASDRHMQEELVNLRDHLQKEFDDKKGSFGDQPTPEQLQELGQMQAEAQNQLQHSVLRAREQINQVQNRLISEFRTQAVEVAQQVAAERGLKIVLARDLGVLYYDGSLDVTDQVAAMLQARGLTAPSAIGPWPTTQPPAPTTAPTTGVETR